jgi:transposase
MRQQPALQSRSVDLYIAFELSASKWLMVLSDGARKSQHTIAAGDVAALQGVIERARTRFKVPCGARMVSCYEAGRDGFWLHRWLGEQGVENLVVDAASIEVSRRARRAKTDRLDLEQLLEKLRRHCAGEKVWSVVRVPSAEEEDLRRVQRERELLVLHNIRMPKGLSKLRVWLSDLVLGSRLKAELQRELERLELVGCQLKAIEAEGAQLDGRAGEQQRQLQRLRAVGPVSATTLVTELFGWRRFSNRRQLGGCAGLVPSPYRSGQMDIEQGISKAGNKRVRPVLVELSWAWLRYQGQSELARWYARRFGSGGKRQRRIGIVALARRLLIALWRFLEHGVIPQGALLRPAR